MHEIGTVRTSSPKNSNYSRRPENGTLRPPGLEELDTVRTHQTSLEGRGSSNSSACASRRPSRYPCSYTSITFCRITVLTSRNVETASGFLGCLITVVALTPDKRLCAQPCRRKVPALLVQACAELSLFAKLLHGGPDPISCPPVAPAYCRHRQ
jgi:hypothetical protein